MMFDSIPPAAWGAIGAAFTALLSFVIQRRQLASSVEASVWERTQKIIGEQDLLLGQRDDKIENMRGRIRELEHERWKQEREYERRLEQVRREHAQEMKRMQADYEARMDNLRRDYEKRIAALASELSDLQVQVKELRR